MIFRTYIDESADQPETVFTIGGFVGPDEEWKNLEPKWLDAVPKKVGYFHATDCFGGHEKFKGMPMADRILVLNRLTDLIVASDIKLIAPVWLYGPKRL